MELYGKIFLMADAGETIGHFTDRMIEDAKEIGEAAHGKFNGIELVAYPDSTPREIWYLYCLGIEQECKAYDQS